MKHLILLTAMASLAACSGGGDSVSSVTDTDTRGDITIPETSKSIALRNLESFTDSTGSDSDTRATTLTLLLNNATLDELNDVSALIDQMVASFEITPTTFPETTTIIKAMGHEGELEGVVSHPGLNNVGTYYTVTPTNENGVDLSVTIDLEVYSWTHNTTNSSSVYSEDSNGAEVQFGVNDSKTLVQIYANGDYPNNRLSNPSFGHYILLNAIRLHNDTTLTLTADQLMSMLTSPTFSGQYAFTITGVVNYDMIGATIVIDQFDDNNIVVSFHRTNGTTETASLTR